jgi:hypothetical protein
MRNRHSTVVSFPAGRVCHLILFVGNKTAQVGKQTSSVHGGDDAMCVCARARKQHKAVALFRCASWGRRRRFRAPSPHSPSFTESSGIHPSDIPVLHQQGRLVPIPHRVHCRQ